MITVKYIRDDKNYVIEFLPANFNKWNNPSELLQTLFPDCKILYTTYAKGKPVYFRCKFEGKTNTGTISQS